MINIPNAKVMSTQKKMRVFVGENQGEKVKKTRTST